MRNRDLSEPSDQGVIWIVDPTPFQSFADRDFEVTRTLNIKNVEIVKCEIAKRSESSDHVLIGTIDSTPFRGFGDRDLESRDASSPDSRNAKSQKCLMHKAVVTSARDGGKS
jgi:hypothetical protein